jgi:DNA-binding CsgD family transcriptional regulator
VQNLTHLDEIWLVFTAEVQQSIRAMRMSFAKSGDQAMVTVDEFSRLVSSIYAAAVTPQHWGSAMRVIQRTFDGSNASGLLRSDCAAWSVDNSSLSPRIAQSYHSFYHRLDHALAAVEQGPVGAVRAGTALMPLLRRSEFYEEWLRPLEIEDGLFVRLTSGPRPTYFIVAAPRRTESFDTPDRAKLMNAMVPHLQQAFHTYDELAALANNTVEMAGALELIRHGLIILAGERQVITLNSAAERIFRAEDGLYMRSGRITATSTRAEHELHCAINNALASEPSTVRTGQSLTCARPSGKRPYVIHVLPSHRQDADDPLRQPTVWVLIIDPEEGPEPPAALLRRLYRLTKAENDIALRMMRGADPKQISDELSVSVTTVRTHLKRIFDKTDTHRQAQLVQLLHALSP